MFGLLVFVNLVMGHSLYLESQYSQLSGLVSQIHLGHSVGNLHVALNFNRGVTRIFDQHVTPPFVNPRISFDTSRSPLHDMFMAESDIGPIFGYKQTASLSIGFELIENFSFQFVKSWQPRSSAFRDVSGIVGLSRSSSILKDRCITIEDAGDMFNGVLIQHCDERLVPHISTATAEVARRDPDWIFLAHISVKQFLAEERVQTITGIRVLFDPSLQEITVPFVHKSTFLEGLGEHSEAQVIGNGRLWVRCDTDVSLTLIVGDKQFSISPISLQMPPTEVPQSDSTLRGLCPLRIRFKTTRLFAIGRQLLRSIDRVVMDFKRQEIGFVPKSSEFPHSIWITPIVMRPLSVPVFSEPEIQTEGGNAGIVFPLSSHQRGLILVRVDAITSREGLERWMAWSFVRTHELSELEIPEDEVIPGRFSGFSVEINEQFVWFRASQTGYQGIVIRRSNRFVHVCLRDGHTLAGPAPISQLAVPPPEIFSGDLDLDDRNYQCSICISPFFRGEHLQRVPGCDHKFHYECVKTWLETRSSTCPNCRFVVRRRPTGQQMQTVPPSASVLCCVVS
jgi:hypothetical protein